MKWKQKMELSVQQNMNITEIIKQYGNKLAGFIRSRVSAKEDAEDILQDVYYRLAEAEIYTKPIDQIASWLFAVARNRIIDQYRKKKIDLLSELFFEDDDDTEMEALAEIMVGDNETPEIIYLRSLIMEEIDNTLDLLPAEQREVFEMTELEGLSFKEISNRTGQPVNTLISRKRYAVLLMRERLRNLYNELINY